MGYHIYYNLPSNGTITVMKINNTIKKKNIHIYGKKMIECGKNLTFGTTVEGCTVFLFIILFSKSKIIFK